MKCFERSLGFVLLALGFTLAFTLASASWPSLASAQGCDASATGTDFTSLDKSICQLLAEDLSGGSFDEATFRGQFGDLLVGAVLLEIEPSETEAILTEVELLSGESARNDKQVGGAGASTGSTSLGESPGLVALLGLAVERGAVTQKKVGTAMHFSTSPYAATALLNGDTAANYQRFEDLTRLNFGMVVPLADADQTSNDLELDDVSELSLKARVLGDRSTRSSRFVKAWKSHFGPRVREILAAESSVQLEVVSVVGRDLQTELRTALVAAINRHLAAPENAGMKDEALRSALLPVVRKELRGRVRGAIDSDRIDAASIRLALDGKVDALKEAYAKLSDDDYREEYIKLLEETEPHILSFEYAYHPVKDGGSDFSDLKGLYQYTLRGDRASVDLLLNGALTFNHEPKNSLNQDEIRSYAASLSLEHHFAAAFLPQFGAQDMTRASFSLSARVDRNEDENATIGSGQAKLDLPLAVGLSAPVTLTYSSRTLERSDDEWRINFGVQVDTDKILAWTRSGNLLSALTE